MSLDIYFRKDIFNILLAQVVATLQQNDGTNFEFVRGKLAGLQAAALSVGVDWGELAATAKGSIDADRGLLGDVGQHITASVKGD